MPVYIQHTYINKWVLRNNVLSYCVSAAYQKAITSLTSAADSPAPVVVSELFDSIDFTDTEFYIQVIILKQ